MNRFFQLLLRSGNELLLSEMQEKMGVTDLVSEIMCVIWLGYFRDKGILEGGQGYFRDAVIRFFCAV